MHIPSWNAFGMDQHNGFADTYASGNERRRSLGTPRRGSCATTQKAQSWGMPVVRLLACSPAASASGPTDSRHPHSMLLGCGGAPCTHMVRLLTEQMCHPG